ncbi:MAG: DUF1015 domain-containing protein [Eubacterium sp.]|nr:DUF1015 domain-containing protein [Eubacterium sp.]
MNQAFYPADILLPKKGTDMTAWSVVACDQFTSEPEYWEDVERIVGQAPSTYRLTLPEVYLETDEEESRLSGIREAMEAYESGDLLVEYPRAMIYIERTDSSGHVRPGIIGAVDLEEYDYHKGSTSLIRATEGTIVERIPPRIRVRSNASLELPHIMILIDDIRETVVEPAGEQTDQMELLYDFDLMKRGGHLKGWLMNAQQQEQVLKAIEQLGEEQVLKARGEIGEDILLFAMGDGNHSLATAKEYYEQLKAAHPGEDLSGHPARYALVELENLHSPALEFEAIHRILTNVNSDHLMHQMTRELGIVRMHRDIRENKPEHEQYISVVIHGQEEQLMITKPSSKLAVGSLQHFLDSYIKEHEREDIKLDYIHGKDNLKALTWQTDSIGFILPDMGKDELFPTVKADGALPRKTFSMGHAEDKRYYTECRRIR